MKIFFLLFFSTFFFTTCHQKNNTIIKIAGEAQGTTYHISYCSESKLNYQTGIDSLLRRIDTSLSTYLPVSIISRINRNDSTALPDDHFTNVFNKSQELAERTGGAFDITVAPVVNAWGFGFSKKARVDSAMIDSLLQYVSYKMVSLQDHKLGKQNPGVMLDFNAIAQGYTVDVIASYFNRLGIENYFIELGGEVKARGKKENEEDWKVGIDKPVEDNPEERTLQAIIKLHNQSLATSGNYRKFYVENGQKYSHIIDPETGYPAKNNLLSTSVLADDCMTADGYATAFMVMGLEKSKEFLAINKDLHLEVFFIYDSKGARETYTSENLKKWMEKLP